MNFFTILKKSLFYFIPPILIIGGMMSAYYFKDLGEEKRLVEAREKLNVTMLEHQVYDALSDIEEDLRLLSSHFELEVFLNTENNATLDALAEEFIAFSKLKKIFDQVRLLDQSGMEVVRINYHNGRAVSVPKDELQNKDKRYYFNEIQKMTKGGIYISPMDLTVEDNEIEQPAKPVFRIGIPLFSHQDRRKGMLILNILGDSFLEDLHDQPSKEVDRYLLVGLDNFYFNSPVNESDWKLIDKGKVALSFQLRYPEVWEQVEHEISGQFFTGEGAFTFATVFPYQALKLNLSPRHGKKVSAGNNFKMEGISWKLISIVPFEFLNMRTKRGLNRLFLTFFLFTLVIGAGSFSLARTSLRRKLSERECAESEERYRQLIENTLYGIVEIDTAGMIVFANDSYHVLLGYLPGELVGSNIMKLTAPESPGQTEPCIATRLSGDQRSELGEGMLLKKDGHVINVEVARSERHGEGGKIIGCTSVVTDISKRKTAENRIEKALSEKEVLLREIHHRVKNNLQIIGSLLYLQAKTVQGKRDREKFKEAQERVQTMALLHEQLYQSEDVVRVHFSQYTLHIVKELIKSYDIDENRIRISSNLEEITLGLDHAIPCGLIINELFSNIFKHAFPDDRKGNVVIDCCAVDDKGYELRISDDGIGLPQGFDMKNSGTLGLRLVSLLAEQIEGEVILEQSKGTRYKIIFKGD